MLLNRFQRFCDSEHLLPNEGAVLLAVSGGIDSVVMAHLCHRSGIRFAIAHCNFGLRGEASEGDARFVKGLADDLGARFFLKKFATTSYAAGKGISIQMAARELRYNWFEQIRVKHGYQAIATAHHLDDQTETFLINLIRGTGLAGLHGIRVRNGHIIRPMMFAWRKDIGEYALQHGIVFRDDHTNQETKYLRNKIRHEILPVLCELNPDFPERLTQTIRIIARHEEITENTLQQWQSEALTQSGQKTLIDINKIITCFQPETFLWYMLSPFGLNETQCNDLMQCLGMTSEKRFETPSHIILKERDKLVIKPLAISATSPEFVIQSFAKKMSIRIPIHLKFIRIKHSKEFQVRRDPCIANFDSGKLEFPLILRKWRQGDEFHPYGMKGMKKLSDFFIDQKLSGEKKDDVWLLCSGDNIVWIVGYRIDHRFRVTKETRDVLIASVQDE